MLYKKYIYIDLGAYDGDSIREFIRLKNLPVPTSKFKIYAFEPNPNMIPWLKELAESVDQEIVVDGRAAWVDNTIQEFTIDTNKRAYGSTLMRSKEDIWNKIQNTQIMIQCFDFSEWIKQFKDDYVIVKMDIEGAEFKVLPHMINQGTHKIMNQLWLETHPNKVKDYTTIASNALFKRLRQDIYVEEWS